MAKVKCHICGMRNKDAQNCSKCGALLTEPRPEQQLLKGYVAVLGKGLAAANGNLYVTNERMIASDLVMPSGGGLLGYAISSAVIAANDEMKGFNLPLASINQIQKHTKGRKYGYTLIAENGTFKRRIRLQKKAVSKWEAILAQFIVPVDEKI